MASGRAYYPKRHAVKLGVTDVLAKTAPSVAPGKRRAPMPDEDVLNLLDLHEGAGLSASLIALQLGMSRSAVLGLIFRVRQDMRAADEDRTDWPPAVKPENQDGALGRGWWRRG
jgi:hypothetical protein